MDLIASHFLAGSVLSWALPIAVLIAVAVYWVVLLRRSDGNA
jgi:cytochrome c-type biogenesis protein CcmH/NrfF